MFSRFGIDHHHIDEILTSTLTRLKTTASHFRPKPCKPLGIYPYTPSPSIIIIFIIINSVKYISYALYSKVHPAIKPSDIIQILLLSPILLPIAIQPIHADILMSPATIHATAHSHSLTASIRALKESAKTLFADFEALGGCGVGHARHGAPEIEGVGYVGADAEENEEDEVDGVTQNYITTLVYALEASGCGRKLTGYYLVPTQCEE
jgi:hypothetical protein